MTELKRINLHIVLLLVACSLVFRRHYANTAFNASADVHLNISSETENRTEAPCPSDWHINLSKTRCFRYTSSSLSWDESEIQCRSYHWHLAAPTYFEELHIVQKLCGESAHGCWIGGRAINSKVGVIWNWSDNTHLNKNIIPGTLFHATCTNFSCHQ